MKENSVNNGRSSSVAKRGRRSKSNSTSFNNASPKEDKGDNGN